VKQRAAQIAVVIAILLLKQLHSSSDANPSLKSFKLEELREMNIDLETAHQRAFENRPTLV